MGAKRLLMVAAGVCGMVQCLGAEFQPENWCDSEVPGKFTQTAREELMATEVQFGEITVARLICMLYVVAEQGTKEAKILAKALLSDLSAIERIAMMRFAQENNIVWLAEFLFQANQVVPVPAF